MSKILQCFSSLFKRLEMPSSYLRRKNRGCSSGFGLLSHQTALLPAYLGLPQRNAAASPPCTRNCPRPPPAETRPHSPPSPEMGSKNMFRPLQEFLCYMHTFTWFQYKSQKTSIDCCSGVYNCGSLLGLDVLFILFICITLLQQIQTAS